MWLLLSGSGWDCCFLLPFLFGAWIMLIGYLSFINDVAPKAVRGWVKQRGYRLVRQRRALLTGPFPSDPSGYRVVYQIEVRDDHGAPRAGWLSVSSRSLLAPAVVEVRWDEPRRAPLLPGAPRPDESPLWDRELDS